MARRMLRSAVLGTDYLFSERLEGCADGVHSGPLAGIRQQPPCLLNGFDLRGDSRSLPQPFPGRWGGIGIAVVNDVGNGREGTFQWSLLLVTRQDPGLQARSREPGALCSIQAVRPQAHVFPRGLRMMRREEPRRERRFPHVKDPVAAAQPAFYGIRGPCRCRRPTSRARLVFRP